MKGLTIGEVSRRSGVPTKTIRYYESVGLLASPDRGTNGYRYYDADAVRTLSFAQRRIADIDHKIAELTRLRDELAHLVDACHGDHRPDCPILDALDGRTAPGEPT